MRLPPYLVLDAKAGFDGLEMDAMPSGHRVALDTAAMRGPLSDTDSLAGVCWIPGPQHRADGRTKTAHHGERPRVLAGEGGPRKEESAGLAERQRPRAALHARGARSPGPTG